MSLTAAASSALADPLRALMLWGLVLTGKLEPALLRMLGLKDVDVQTVEATYAAPLLELRTFRAAGKFMDPAELGRLIMVRISCILLCDPDEKQLLQATRCAARLPLWVRDPELDALEREARREAATTRILEARARRAELQERSAANRSTGCKPATGARALRPASSETAPGSADFSLQSSGAPLDRAASSGAPASAGIPEKGDEGQARPGAPEVRQTLSGGPVETHTDAPEEASDPAKTAFLVMNSEVKVKSQPPKPRPNARRKATLRR